MSLQDGVDKKNSESVNGAAKAIAEELAERQIITTGRKGSNTDETNEVCVDECGDDRAGVDEIEVGEKKSSPQQQKAATYQHQLQVTRAKTSFRQSQLSSVCRSDQLSMYLC